MTHRARILRVMKRWFSRSRRPPHSIFSPSLPPFSPCPPPAPPPFPPYKKYSWDRQPWLWDTKAQWQKLNDTLLRNFFISNYDGQVCAKTVGGVARLRRCITFSPSMHRFLAMSAPGEDAGFRKLTNELATQIHITYPFSLRLPPFNRRRSTTTTGARTTTRTTTSSCTAAME